jgi:hypothetical protein
MGVSKAPVFAQNVTQYLLDGPYMCNLYSITKGPQAIRDFARVMRSDVGNLPTLPGVFPDYSVPIVRNGPEGCKLVLARWGMPSPFEALKGKNRDPGVTNIRNLASPHWKAARHGGGVARASSSHSTRVIAALKSLLALAHRAK